MTTELDNARTALDELERFASRLSALGFAVSDRYARCAAALRGAIELAERLEADAARSRETGERILADAINARAEAFKRYDGDRIVDDETGEETSHDDWGYAATAREAFVAGAAWASEMLSAPPTEDEREAIADIVRFEGDDEWEIADAILASPVWRGRSQDVSDNAEKDASTWLANYHGSIDSTALILAFKAGRRGRALGPITDEMVDAAQDAYHEFVLGPAEPPLTAREKGITRQAWRVSLEAAAEAQR